MRAEATCRSWTVPCCTRRYISPSILAIRSRLSPVPRRSRWRDHSSDDSASRCAESNRRPSAAPWLYGLNATVSVGATALHAGLAPIVGLIGTTLLAASCYAVGALLIFLTHRPEPATTELAAL